MMEERESYLTNYQIGRNMTPQEDGEWTPKQAEAFLMQQYCMLGEVSANASPNVFSKRVPIANLEKLNDHFCQVFREISDSKEWQLTGM